MNKKLEKLFDEEFPDFFRYIPNCHGKIAPLRKDIKSFIDTHFIAKEDEN